MRILLPIIGALLALCLGMSSYAVTEHIYLNDNALALKRTSNLIYKYVYVYTESNGGPRKLEEILYANYGTSCGLEYEVTLLSDLNNYILLYPMDRYETPSPNAPHVRYALKPNMEYSITWPDRLNPEHYVFGQIGEYD